MYTFIGILIFVSLGILASKVENLWFDLCKLDVINWK